VKVVLPNEIKKLKRMNKYLITYHNAQMPADPEMMQQAKMAFGKWLQEAGPAVIDPGAPVSVVTQLASCTPSQAVDMGGYSIIEAENDAEASRILKTHPFISRGGTLQLNKIIGV
jgi:hypothetical protein